MPRQQQRKLPQRNAMRLPVSMPRRRFILEPQSYTLEIDIMCLQLPDFLDTGMEAQEMGEGHWHP